MEALVRRKAFLLCKNPCGWAAMGGRGSSSQSRQSPRKEISRGNLLCAASGPTNLSYPRLPSTQKYVTTPDWKNFCTRQPQGARGTAVPLFREESRGTPSKGFLWATSSRRLDTALLCAAKKRGVETYQAGRALPVNPWSLDHGSSKKATCCGAGSIPKNMQKPQKPCSCKYIPLVLYCG